jgi:hypothetical protein
VATPCLTDGSTLVDRTRTDEIRDAVLPGVAGVREI